MRRNGGSSNSMNQSRYHLVQGDICLGNNGIPYSRNNGITNGTRSQEKNNFETDTESACTIVSQETKASTQLQYPPLEDILTMSWPGRSMGPRPPDFDEEIVRKTPTFQKWQKLQSGQELSYAGRRFMRGGKDQEERLMRRIMISRRNNLKFQAELQRARANEARQQRGVAGTRKKIQGGNPPEERTERPSSLGNPSGIRQRRVAGMLLPTDEEILEEMDVAAVEATRTYRKWLALPEGTALTYNQTYVRGDAVHDWLLRKNIWRRMRYRRENRARVSAHRTDVAPVDEEKVAPGSQAAVEGAAATAAQGLACVPGRDATSIAVAGTKDPAASSVLDATVLRGSGAGVGASVVGVIKDTEVEARAYSANDMQKASIIHNNSPHC